MKRSGSNVELISVRRRPWTILSMVFVRWEVRATGLSWFSSPGWALFGTGTTLEVFHRTSTVSRLRFRLNMYWTTLLCWSAHSLSNTAKSHFLHKPQLSAVALSSLVNCSETCAMCAAKSARIFTCVPQKCRCAHTHTYTQGFSFFFLVCFFVKLLKWI